MMHGAKKSGPPIVPTKPANKAEHSAAESVEGSGGAKRNAELQSTVRTQGREAVSQAQARIRGAVSRNNKEKLTALLHHVSVDVLRWAFFNLKKRAAPGVDGLIWVDYAADLDRNLTDLHARVHSGAYRALPSRRKFIPKADGKQRPLGIAALEDKIVQAAVVAVLTPVYEAEFLGFSYGFRPGRNQHDALDALAYGVNARKINWVLDADIARYFDRVSHEWLERFLEHRIADKRMLRLIQKWLKVGVLEDGIVVPGEVGTGQGSVISPLLANVYLHYAFDLWAEQWRRREAKGDMIIVRYADDIVVGFQHEADAKRFRDDMGRRLAEFALTLHPEKTRLIEFGRFAAENRARRGLGKPETFNFLGLRHICGRSRRGTFQLRRHTRADRMRAKLKELKVELMRRRHQPLPAQGRWLGQVVGGFFGYHAVPTNSAALSAFLHHVKNLWQRALRRRSQKDRLTCERMNRLAADLLPKPLVRHPWPSTRFAATHPRWEPYALIGPVRFCAGGAQQ